MSLPGADLSLQYLRLSITSSELMSLTSMLSSPGSVYVYLESLIHELSRTREIDWMQLGLPTVVGKCENVIFILIRHETYANMSGFSDKSKSHSNFSFLIRALEVIYIFV